MQEIGLTIRTARKQQRLSQAQLGLFLGMSRATISGVETGKVAEIGIRKMMALCTVLGLELVVSKRSAHPYPTLQELRQQAHEQKRT